MDLFFKKSFLVVSMIMLLGFNLNAQTLTVSGTVRDAQDNETLPGVSITVKGKNKSTLSTINGTFKLSGLEASDVIVFTYVGYNSKSIPLTQVKNGVLDVVLSSSVSKLDEVVVVGYGATTRSQTAASIGSIKADQMDNFAGGSLNTSLQGKIAGLQVTSTTGEPGGGFNITLRGVSSINGASEPLIIIDGVPVNNEPYSSLVDNVPFSPLNDINPSDIESIEVLKDAASASIYGSRASNGVILITTKRGKEGKPQLNLVLNSSMVDITRTIGVLNGPEFRSAYTDAIVNATGKYTSQVPLIDSLHPYYRTTFDWQNEMYTGALQYKADLSVSGQAKDKSFNYYVSGSYRDLKPVVLGTKYKQATGAVKIDYKISKAIEGGFNLNVSNNSYSRVNSTVIGQYVALFPVYNPYNPITGNLVNVFTGGRLNPIAIAEYATNDIDRTRYLITQNLNIKLAKPLTFQTRVSYDYNNTQTNYFMPPVLMKGSNGAPSGQYSPSFNSSFVNENYLTFKKSFSKKHDVNIVAGQSYQLFKSNTLFFRGIDPLDNTINTLGAYGALANYSQTKSENALLSFFGRANYSYKYKYILSAVLRADGSSRFGAQDKFGYFPSISGAWRFTKEKFLENKIKWMSDGKLRLSYGVTGNQNIGNYATQGIYSKAGIYGGAIAIVNTGLANEALKWEVTKSLNAGMDLEFLKGKISFTGDAYIKNTDGLLFNVQVPSQSGYRSVPYNFGSLSNRGFEFSLSASPVNKNLRWNTILTFGLNRNEVTSLPNGEDYVSGASLARVGQPVGVFFGYRALGVYARDEDNVYKTNDDGTVVPYRKGSSTGPVYKGGDMIFEDVNGDGIIGLEDQQIIGNPNPDFSGGWQNNFRYKNFSFGFFINYVIGNDIYNQLRRNTDGSLFDTNYTTDVLRRWRKQGDVTDVPMLRKGDPMENNAVSTHFIEDGSFIRLQNVTFGYNLPSKLIRKAGFSNANLQISAQNLATFGTYSGYDPEVSTGSDGLAFGVDRGAFPRTTSYNVTLNLKF